MKVAWGMSWDDSKKGSRVLAAVFCALLAVSFASPGQMSVMAQATDEMVSVIVRELPGASSEAEHAVVEAGGEIGVHIDLIDGFVAEVPHGALGELTGLRTVHSVTPNRKVKLMGAEYVDHDATPGSLYNVARDIKAHDMWKDGYTGQGVDVAVIDSGVAPVDGLMSENKVYFGPDLSFEGGSPVLHDLDTFGHGTHMAGIIAGRDNAVGTVDPSDRSNFLGIAPDARIVSLKVANSVGATDVSQVIVALDWIVDHRTDYGLNIKVLNLSFGTDGTQDYRYDPLTYAVEQAWHNGIFVAVAAGNSQYGTDKINNPAYDPFVVAVGADDTKGTRTTDDDEIPAWSAKGDGTRNPDLVAPGKSIVSLRTPGSFIDQQYPGGRLGERFFKGSGTSQATAVVSGAAALVYSQNPALSPDDVKALLMENASELPNADQIAQGEGLIDLDKVGSDLEDGQGEDSAQEFERATGTGSLQGARGTQVVADPNGATLTGEMDIFGNAWDGSGWSGSGWSGSGWSGAVWSGSGWSGSGWSGSGWSGSGWSGSGWSGSGWSGSGWSGSGWSGSGWSGSGWSGSGWSGSGWSGSGWSGSGWSGSGWSGSGWSGSGWSGSGWSGSGWSGSGWD